MNESGDPMNDQALNTPALQRIKAQYAEALRQLDKNRCVQIATTALAEGVLSIETLYTAVLASALNEISDAEQGTARAIWQEHVRSEITRTVLENCYPFVARVAAQRRALDGGLSQGKVLIVMPTDEYHELGARMGADFFELCGFEVQFAGSNTPSEAIMQGYAHFQPDFIDIHVVNYYNLFKARELISHIRQRAPHIKILASGHAFTSERDQAANFGPLCLIETFADVASLREIPL